MWLALGISTTKREPRCGSGRRAGQPSRAYMLLFNGDRPRADILMVSMKSWITERRSNAGTLDAQKLDDFAKWVGQRETIAGQTSALSATTASFRSW